MFVEVIRSYILYMCVCNVYKKVITKMYKMLFAIKTTNFQICANVNNSFPFVSY